MNQLIVVQVTNAGVRKTWRLNHHQQRFIFGTSRNVQLQSIDTDCDSFEAVIENTNNSWMYFSFNSKQSVITNIENDLVIKLPNSSLYFYFINKADKYAEQLYRFRTEGIKLIDRAVIKALTTYSLKSSFSGEQSKYVKAVVISFIVLIGLPLLLFQKKQIQISEIPQTTNSVAITVKNIPKKVKQAAATKTVALNSATQQKPNPGRSAPTGGGSHKVAQKIKSSLGARFSQLLGKVSATEARNAQAIAVSQGIKANEGPSGRSLSNVGAISKSGSNWAAQAGNGNGQGQVSVNGLGGGSNLKGLGGGLGQGKVGSGGVNLIEEESEVVGGLDREIIAQYIKTKLGQILYCYERQLSATPDIFGKINVKFTIAGSGEVETQLINDTTLKNKPVENCVLGKIAKWKFPEPKGGTKVVVTYPFLFKSTN